MGNRCGDEKDQQPPLATIADVERFLLVFLLLKKVLSTSSYGHFTATKEFWSQCHILLVLMEGALNGAFKGTFKGKFERHSSLVNLRGNQVLIRLPMWPF